MVFLSLLRTFILVLPLLAFPVFGNELSIVREENGFPRCVENIKGKNLFFKWSRKSLTRTIRYAFTKQRCNTSYRELEVHWKKLNQETKKLLPENVIFELEQIEMKANELREEKTAAEFIEKRNIATFTRELNRDLTPRFGPIFATEVFKELVEKEPENKEFRNFVLKDLRKEREFDFSPWKKDIKLVVSFGLGWKADYGKAAPYYIKDFLADIEVMGFEVVYLEKNPFGSINGNVKKITPQIEAELKKDKSVIFLSLCKGTPELLSALKDLDPGLKRKIVGHVNLSGMLTGTFFADIAASVRIPKFFAPFMKIIPLKTIRDMGLMADASSHMKSAIVSESLSNVRSAMPEEILTVNITGAPLSDRVLRNGSPMAPVVKYNYWQKYLVSANDGFIELPHTLIPEEIAPHQVTLVLDSSHMLSDGYIEEFTLRDRDTRRKLYQSILRFILKAN